MFHSRIIANPAAPPLEIHHQFCRCTDCRQTRDPIGFSKARRIVRLQAFALIALAVGFYSFAAFNAGPIAASVGLGQ